MSKLIYTARFLDGREYSSGNATYLSDSIDYNATREGTEIITLEKTLQYNAQRPGVDVINDGDIDHGLFSFNGKCNLEREKQNVVDAYQNGSIVWKAIISLHEDDAIDKGLDLWEDWKNLVCNHVPKIAEIYGIDLKNFRWNAGYHTNTDNPHIHLTFYSTNPDEGRLSKNNTIASFKRIKSAIVNDLFKEELDQLKVDKTNLRNVLKNEMSSKRHLNLIGNDKLRKMVIETLEVLPRAGRKYYTYMPDNVKININCILKEMISSDEVLKLQYDKYKSNHKEFVKVYNTEDAVVETKMKEFDERFFSPTKNDFNGLHNAILKELYKLNGNNELSAANVNNHSVTILPEEIKTATNIEKSEVKVRKHDPVKLLGETKANINDELSAANVNHYSVSTLAGKIKTSSSIEKSGAKIHKQNARILSTEIKIGSYNKLNEFKVGKYSSNYDIFCNNSIMSLAYVLSSNSRSNTYNRENKRKKTGKVKRKNQDMSI